MIQRRVAKPLGDNWVVLRYPVFKELIRRGLVKDNSGNVIHLKDPEDFIDTLDHTFPDPQAFKNFFIGRGKEVIELDNGQKIKFSDISKTATFEPILKGPGAGVSEPKVANRGDVAEGILAAALFARVLNRKGGEKPIVAPINRNDVIKVFEMLERKKQLKQKAKSKTPTAYAKVTISRNDIDPKVKDFVVLEVHLSNTNFDDLVTKAPRLMAQEIEAAVRYANSKNVTRYANALYFNSLSNRTSIIADGISDQTGTKVDVYMTIEGRTREIPGNRTKINVSLKVGGGDQFGQLSGSDFKRLTGFFSRFGVDISSLATKYQDTRDTKGPVDAFEVVYKFVHKQLEKDLAQNRDAHVLKTFATGVVYYATLNDPAVTLVHLGKNDFKELNFRNFANKFAQVNLGIKWNSGASYPEFSILNKDKKVRGKEEVILTFRNRADGKNKKGEWYFRNLILKGPGLASLIKDLKANFDD